MNKKRTRRKVGSAFTHTSKQKKLNQREIKKIAQEIMEEYADVFQKLAQN